MNFRSFALIAVLTVPITACATSGPALNATVDPSVAAVVEMTPTLNFTPTELRIKPGDTVEFRNVSGFAHTVSTVPDTAAETATVQLPVGAAAFDSGPIEAGGVYRQTFDTPGVYRYFCDPHHGAGMVGTIIVEAAEAMNKQMDKSMNKPMPSSAAYASDSSYSSGSDC